MCLAQGPQRSDAGEARTRGPSVSRKINIVLQNDKCLTPPYLSSLPPPPPPPCGWHVELLLKETKSVTMNIFRKFSFLFESFVKVELSYVFTIKMLSTAENASVENCTEKWYIL